MNSEDNNNKSNSYQDEFDSLLSQIYINSPEKVIILFHILLSILFLY